MSARQMQRRAARLKSHKSRREFRDQRDEAVKRGDPCVHCGEPLRVDVKTVPVGIANADAGTYQFAHLPCHWRAEGNATTGFLD